MILVLLAALSVVSVPLAGGNLGALARIELRCLWAAPLALVLQVVILTIAPDGNRGWHIAIHLVSYGLAAVFIWANRRLPGARLIGAGTLLNVFAIVANGGVMPRWETAQRLAGLAVEGGFRNSAVVAHPHLLVLGDIIPVPAPFPLGNVLSIGDCLLYAGALVLLHGTCRRTPAPDRQVVAPAAPAYPGEGAAGGSRPAGREPR